VLLGQRFASTEMVIVTSPSLQSFGASDLSLWKECSRTFEATVEHSDRGILMFKKLMDFFNLNTVVFSYVLSCDLFHTEVIFMLRKCLI